MNDGLSADYGAYPKGKGTRVSALLSPEMWGGLDRWAEANGVTRSEAVVEAVRRLVDEHESFILGAGQMATLHPDLVGERRDIASDRTGQ